MAAADKPQPQISVAAGVIALRGVKLFLSAGRAAAEKKAQAPPPVKRKGKKVNQKIPPAKTVELLVRTTKFTKHELEALYGMYRRLVAAAQAAVPTSAIDPPPKTEGIDQSTFRSVMHSTLGLVTEEAVLERLWVSWERGAAGGEGALRFDPWARGLSVLLRGSPEERRRLCFNVYDLNADGYITKDEMFQLLKNSLLKQPGDEDPDEGVRDLVELVLRKLDADKDGRVSLDDYREAVEQEPLLLEAFGQCLPSKRHAAAFLRTLVTNNNNNNNK